MADNIAAAVVISGAVGSVTGDNTGYTLEANEAVCLGYVAAGALGYGGGRTAWFKWVAPATGTAVFDTGDAGGSPITDTIVTVIGGSDFTTATVLAQNDDNTPPGGFYSQVSFACVTGTTYYIAVDGYNGVATDNGGYDITATAVGGFTLSWVAPAPTYEVNAEDGATAAGTVTLDGSTPAYVKDSQYRVVDDTTSVFKSDVDYTESFYVDTGAAAIPSGWYDVDLYAKYGGTDTSKRVLIQVWRNGVPVGPAILYGDQGGAEATNGAPAYMRLTGSPLSPGSKQGPQKIGVNAGDILSFRIGQWDVAPSGRRFLEVQKIKFTQITAGSVPMPSKPATGSVPDIGATAGAAMFNVRDHGGASGADSDTDSVDFVVMPDGVTIYATYAENPTSPSGDHYLYLKKWDGASWSTLSNNVWGRGSPAASGTYICWGGVSIDTDGTDLWIAWHEFQRPGAPAGKSVVRVFKYDVGGASLTQIGSDIHHFSGAGTGTTGVGQDAGENGMLLKVAPNGTLWLSWAETDSDTTGTPNTHNYPFLYHWNGSAWVDDNLPFLAYRRNIDPHVTSVNTVEEFGLNHVAFTFCHHDGPSDYPSVIYQADWLGAVADGDPIVLEFIYHEYNGSSWSSPVRFIPESVWTGLFSASGHGNWHEGFGLTDDGNVPYLFAQLGRNTNDSDHTVVGKMKSDGSAFEPVGDGFPDQELTPYYGDTWSYAMNGVGGVVGGVPVLIVKNPDGWGLGFAVISKGENGSGTGWQKASQHADQWGEDFNEAAAVKVAGNSIYIMYDSFGDSHGFLGIWKFDLKVGRPQIIRYR